MNKDENPYDVSNRDATRKQILRAHQQVASTARDIMNQVATLTEIIWQLNDRVFDLQARVFQLEKVEGE